MIAEHFWKLVALAIAAVAGFFYWQKWERQRVLQQSTEELAVLIDPASYPPETSEREFESQVFRLLAYLDGKMRDAVAGGGSADGTLTELINAAAAARGLDKKYATALVTTFRSMFKTCDDLGILSNPLNQNRLEFGKHPEIKRGPYEGEDLVVAYGLSPLVAEEARVQLVNATLVPRPVRSMTDATVTGAAYDFANRLRDIGVLTDGHFDRVKLLHRASGERR